MWVVDASVAVRWFIEQEYQPHAEQILHKMISHPEKFAIPELFSFEVYAVLCRMIPKGAEVFIEGMIPILNCGILRYPMTENLAHKAAIFIELGLTGYDACYAALAKEVNGTWLTFDEKAHALIENQKISHAIMRNMPPEWED